MSVSPTTVSISVGATAQLIASVLDGSGTVITGRAVTWSSSNAGVAAVSAGGTVTGVATGSASITAAVGAVSTNIQVTVTPPPVATVSVTPETLSIPVGSTGALVVTVRDAANNVLTDRAVIWSTSNASIVTVSSSGLVSGVSAGGPVTITATSEGKTGSASVTVVPPPVATISLSPAAGSVSVAGSLQITATLRDAANNVLTNRTITWTSSNSAILSVNAGGIVTGVAIGGPVTVTATSEGRSGTALINVVGGIVDISTGEAHTCAIQAGNGALFCWGYNEAGQLGNGSTVDRVLPAAVTGGRTWIAVDLGAHHSCALATGGVAYCWGYNSRGQLGDGTFSNRSTPVAVATAQTFTSISAGGIYINFFGVQIIDVPHSCALTSAGLAYCWGNNSSGALGDGSSSTRSTPVAVNGGVVFTRIRAGRNFSCGLTAAGEAYCWGANGFGQLGNGTTTSRSTPGPVSTSLRFIDIDAGQNHVCAVATTGAAYCWGYNFSGQLGNGVSGSQGANTSPSPVLGGHVFQSIVAGTSHTCGITPAGNGYCWGENGSGSLGDGTTTDATSPVAVSGNLRFTKLSTNDNHTCGLTASSEAWCWGTNGFGQLGNGTTTSSSVPLRISLPAAFVASTVAGWAVEKTPRSRSAGANAHQRIVRRSPPR